MIWQRARKDNSKLLKGNDTSKIAEKEEQNRKLKENVNKVLQKSDNKQIMENLISSLKTGDHFKSSIRAKPVPPNGRRPPLPPKPM